MDSLLVRGRQIAEQYNRDGEGFKNVGRKNAYECESCGYYIVTIDRDPGVTPFMVKCENCGGMASSKFYRVQEYLSPTHQWYRPDSLAGIDTRYYDHLERGGLILRAIDGKGWCRPEELKRAFEDAEKMERKFKLAEAAILSRQQRRHKARKNPEPPEEITMYGHRYRRVN